MQQKPRYLTVGECVSLLGDMRVEAREPNFKTKNGDVVSEWKYWAGSRCGEAFVTRVGEN